MSSATGFQCETMTIYDSYPSASQSWIYQDCLSGLAANTVYRGIAQTSSTSSGEFNLHLALYGEETYSSCSCNFIKLQDPRSIQHAHQWACSDQLSNPNWKPFWNPHSKQYSKIKLQSMDCRCCYWSCRVHGCGWCIRFLASQKDVEAGCYWGFETPERADRLCLV